MSAGKNIFSNKDNAAIQNKDRIETPKIYQVILHNDDYTSMEFVVHILCEIFHKQSTEANRIMFDVHTNGRSIAGSYPFDIAATKASQVATEARRFEFPLKCTLQEA